MHFLDFIKPDMQSDSNFCNHKSAVVCCFRVVFGFDLSKYVLSNSGYKARRLNNLLDLMIPTRPAGMLV